MATDHWSTSGLYIKQCFWKTGLIWYIYNNFPLNCTPSHQGLVSSFRSLEWQCFCIKLVLQFVCTVHSAGRAVNSVLRVGATLRMLFQTMTQNCLVHYHNEAACYRKCVFFTLMVYYGIWQSLLIQLVCGLMIMLPRILWCLWVLRCWQHCDSPGNRGRSITWTGVPLPLPWQGVAPTSFAHLCMITSCRNFIVSSSHPYHNCKIPFLYEHIMTPFINPHCQHYLFLLYISSHTPTLHIVFAPIMLPAYVHTRPDTAPCPWLQWPQHVSFDEHFGFLNFVSDFPGNVPHISPLQGNEAHPIDMWDCMY